MYLYLLCVLGASRGNTLELDLIDSCVLLCVCRGPIPDSVEEHQVLFITESSLQPL